MEAGWVQAFVVEQRLLDVPGDRIGDSLAVIESHVAETGEPAQEAFGDPVEYARAAAPVDRVRVPFDTSWVVGLFFGLAGLLVTSAAAPAWLGGATSLEVTVATLATAVVVLAAAGLTIFASRTVLRLAAQRPWRTSAGWLVVVLVLVACFLLLREPLLSVNISVAVWTGIGLLGAGVLLMGYSALTGRTTEDPITGPGESRRRTGGWLAVLIFPLMTVVVTAFSWLMAQIPTWF